MQRKPAIINIRGTDCPPELEEKFNRWYDETHIPMLLESGEIKAVTRYKRIDDDNSYPKYAAIYEFENWQAFERYQKSKSLLEAREEIKQSWPDKRYESKWSVQYEVIKSWNK